MTIDDLIKAYRKELMQPRDGVLASLGDFPENRISPIQHFLAYLEHKGYEVSVRLTRAAAERKRDTLLAERDAIEEKLAAIEQELKQ